MGECGNGGMREWGNAGMGECGNGGMREWGIYIHIKLSPYIDEHLLKLVSSPLNVKLQTRHFKAHY